MQKTIKGVNVMMLNATSTIFQLYRGGFIVGENQRPAASHWQTLSYNVVSSTPRLSGIRTHNVNGERLWLHTWVIYSTTIGPRWRPTAISVVRVSWFHSWYILSCIYLVDAVHVRILLTNKYFRNLNTCQYAIELSVYSLIVNSSFKGETIRNTV